MFGSQYVVEQLLLRVFTPATKPRKLMNGLNTLKPWFTTLQRHMRLQMTKKISGQNARLTQKKRSGAIRHPSLSTHWCCWDCQGEPQQKRKKIAKEIGTSRRTIGRTVKEDLNFKSYKLRRRQLLTQVQKERRKLKVSALIDDLKHTSSGMLRFFSDKKIFVQDMKQTNRITGGWVLPLKKWLLSCTRSILSTSWCLASLAVMETSWKLSSFLIAYILVPIATWGFWTNKSSPGWTWWLMEGRPMYFNRTLLLPTRPGPPRPGSLPMCLTTGHPTCGLPHRQTVTLSIILCGAFWRIK